MSSANPSEKLDKPALPMKRNVASMPRLNASTAEATREKARERMSRLRENTKPLKARLQRKQRRGRDAENREVLRKRKFVAEFGETAFHDYYLTHQRLLGLDELPGISRQYRKDIHKKKFEAARDESGIGGVCPDSAKPKRDRLLAFTTTIFMVCKAPFYPNRRNYTSDREHDGNSRKSWFLVLRAGLFTKRWMPSIRLTSPALPSSPSATRVEAQAHWAADCREFHPHGRDNDDGEGSEEENEPSRPSSPPPFSTPARSAPRSTTRACSAPANTVRASVKREAKTPLFREDGEVSPLSRLRKRPTHLVSLRTPGPDASSSRVSPPSTAGSISSVSSLSASVGSSASRTAPPLRSLPQYPPSSRPAAPHLHAGGSASAGVGAQSRRHAELPVLFNNSTRTLYKDVATAVREMGKEDSIQVLEVEDLEEFLSVPPRAAA
ncbi:hypothetical protein B0H13DRAFT_2305524 [Mycena leptocephala]|nr:hypothetical protein B0H13DRAFT_2305524 [Mycena leptocephala]